jgi:hypothetical protein
MYPARSIPMLDLEAAPWTEIIFGQGDIDDKLIADYTRDRCQSAGKALTPEQKAKQKVQLTYKQTCNTTKLACLLRNSHLSWKPTTMT